MPNAYNGSGLVHVRAAEQPRGACQVWNTPASANEALDGEEACSYVFAGQLGYLDNVLAGQDLMPFVTGAALSHTNSDEVPIFDYSTEFKQPAQQEIYEPGP